MTWGEFQSYNHGQGQTKFAAECKPRTNSLSLLRNLGGSVTKTAGAAQANALYCGRTKKTDDCFFLNINDCEDYWTDDSTNDKSPDHKDHNPWSLCKRYGNECNTYKYIPNRDKCNIQDHCFTSCVMAY